MTDARVLKDLLDAAIDSTHADFGNVQLVDSTGDYLVIAAQRGFLPAFLQTFARVDRQDGTVCGRAWRARERVAVADVNEDVAFAPHRRAAMDAGYRAVQSTPMISRRGFVLGVISTHTRQARRVSPEAALMLELCARIGAAYLESGALEPQVARANSDVQVWSFETGVELAEAIDKLKHCARTESPRRCETVARSVCQLAESRVSGLITISQRPLELF